MTGSTVMVVLGLCAAALLTAAACLLLSASFVDGVRPAPTTTHAVADISALLPTAIDRAMP